MSLDLGLGLVTVGYWAWLLLRTLRFVILGDFGIHAENNLMGLSLNFLVATTTTGLSENIIAPIHIAGYTLDSFFFGDKEHGLEIEFSTFVMDGQLPGGIETYFKGVRLTGRCAP